MRGREAAQHDAQRRRPTQAEDGERQRVGQGLEDDRRHAPIRPHVDAEVAGERPADEAGELHRQRLVEPHPGDELRLHLGRGAGPERHADGIARHHVDHGEQQHHRDQHDDQGEADSLGRVDQHGPDAAFRR
jgi:hypothetical protein